LEDGVETRLHGLGALAGVALWEGGREGGREGGVKERKCRIRGRVGGREICRKERREERGAYLERRVFDGEKLFEGLGLHH